MLNYPLKPRSGVAYFPPLAYPGAIPRKGGRPMRKYEVIFIIHPDLDDTSFEEIVERVKEWINEAGGKVDKVDLWGKRKLAYPIRKQLEGQYVLLNTEMPPTFFSELERNLRLLESVMRFIIVQQEEE
jgi:small subunit ribosomal protein S6